ncbi:MAG: threonylcarbamoyl-AMP synthase [Rhodospirillales bacterium]|nr:threonylcarbamoyl-AMP synthase [Rhodospirillales bacterium]
MPRRPSRIAKPTRAAIARAAALLRRGAPVAFPTETVYGLGGDATSDRAVAGIFAAKARPRFNPLIVHLGDLRAAARLVRFDARARALASAFWPGPLTLILPRRPGCRVSWLASAGLDTLAVRVPDHPVALALLRAVGRPVAAPSANRSGRISPTAARDVARSLGPRVSLILDGGRCQVGVESTVVDLSGPAAVLLRPGGVPREAIERVIGPLGRAGAGRKLKSPGQLPSHYAPTLPLRLAAAAPRRAEAYLAFGKTPAKLRPEAVRNLSPSGDLAEAASNLFAMLRALDRPEFSAIAVARIPDRGLGAAINDRLARAAAPRR